MKTDRPLHVVLGAGLGTLVVDALVAAGHRVRHVRRGPIAARIEVETMRGDLANQSFANTAAKGASVIYDCSTPPYEKWESELLPLGESTLRAAISAQARLVALDNLYMYGAPSGPMREDSPVHPIAKKGVLRARLTELRLAAHERGELSVVIGRGSDFFGPGVHTAAVFGDRFFQRVLAGKSAEVVGDPNQPHAYSYGPDVARALVTLGTHDDVSGIFHLPTPTAEPIREMIARFSSALGRTIAISRLPDWLLHGVGVFSPLMRAVAEMTYQWKTPFVVDDTKFRKRFGAVPTPLDEAIAATVAWARSAYSPKGAPHEEYLHTSS